MNTDSHRPAKASYGDYVVRSPRPTDAVGHALRGVFGETPMPDDLMVLLRRLDRVTH